MYWEFTATLQTNELSKGVYIVRTSIDGEIITQKLIEE
ncbi:T9SS type A sorting domain-containing protein [Flavobacterium sp. XS2P14]